MPTILDLEKQINIQLAEKESIRERLEICIKQNETLQAERRSFMESFKTEERQHRQVLEAELKKMNVDLNRLRQARDNIQKTLDLKISKENLELKQQQELFALAEARKERLTCLEQDLMRLKVKCAAQLNEPELMTFFLENPESNPYLESRKEIE